MASFSHQQLIFHKILSDWKCPQISRTLLNILADLSNAVVQISSARSPCSCSSSPLLKPLWTILNALTTIGITVTFMFHNFSNSLARPKYLFLFSFSLIFTLWSAEPEKSTIQQVLSFFLY